MRARLTETRFWKTVSRKTLFRGQHDLRTVRDFGLFWGLTTNPALHKSKKRTRKPSFQCVNFFVFSNMRVVSARISCSTLRFLPAPHVSCCSRKDYSIYAYGKSFYPIFMQKFETCGQRDTKGALSFLRIVPVHRG